MFHQRGMLLFETYGYTPWYYSHSWDFCWLFLGFCLLLRVLLAVSTVQFSCIGMYPYKYEYTFTVVH